MNATRRRLSFILAFSAVCLSGVVHGAGSMESGGASFSPEVVRSWTNSINGLLGSQTPDLTTLSPILFELRKGSPRDPALAPIYELVQTNARTLLASAQGAPASAALAGRFAALNILRDFQLEETRSRVFDRFRAYRSALPDGQKKKIQQCIGVYQQCRWA